MTKCVKSKDGIAISAQRSWLTGQSETWKSTKSTVCGIRRTGRALHARISRGTMSISPMGVTIRQNRLAGKDLSNRTRPANSTATVCGKTATAGKRNIRGRQNERYSDAVMAVSADRILHDRRRGNLPGKPPFLKEKKNKRGV